MSVLVATEDDIPLITELARTFYSRSHWVDAVAFDEAVFNGYLHAWLTSDQFTVFVSPRGFIAVGIMPLYFSAEPAVIEIVFYCEDGLGSALRAAAEEWALQCGVRPVLMGCHDMERVEAASRWYSMSGYQEFDRCFIKVMR